jgi:hypothetical protein
VGSVRRALLGEHGGPIPVTPHWWGLYKFQHAGLIRGYEEEARAWAMTGAELVAVDEKFYRSFRPDMLHLSAGAVRRGTDADARDTERRREAQRMLPELRRLDSTALIDEFADLVSPSKDEILASGVYDHVRTLARTLGESVFIAMNEGNPICTALDPDGWLGFEQGMLLMAERPHRVAYLLARLYEGLRPRMQALAECGCHGYIGSETYCSADLISPAMYREIVFPAQKGFYRTVAALGMLPITYFLGDVMPLLGDIARLGVAGLMVEESKKGFSLDVVEIARRLQGAVCLFGNLDSIWCLLRGSEEDARRETNRQLEAARFGPFVMASGSPIAFDTPAGNIAAMIATARGS